MIYPKINMLDESASKMNFLVLISLVAAVHLAADARVQYCNTIGSVLRINCSADTSHEIGPAVWKLNNITLTLDNSLTSGVTTHNHGVWITYNCTDPEPVQLQCTYRLGSQHVTNTIRVELAPTTPPSPPNTAPPNTSTTENTPSVLETPPIPIQPTVGYKGYATKTEHSLIVTCTLTVFILCAIT